MAFAGKKLDKNKKVVEHKKATLNSVKYSIYGLTLLGILILTIVTSVQIGNFLRQELNLRIGDVVQIVAEKIDGDFHHQVQTVSDEKSAAFIKLKNDLVVMREHSTDISNIYTMRKLDNGEFVFIVDGSAKDQNAVGDIYPAKSVSETLINVFNATPSTTEKYVEPEIYTDDWGTWLSAYAPIFTSSGKLDGIVGIDISAESIQTHQLEFVRTIAIAAFVVILFTLPFMFRLMKFISTMIQEREQANLNFERQQYAIDKHAIVSITDKSGLITYANEKFATISGYSQAELMGQNHRLLNSGQHPKEFFIEMWRTISSGNAWEARICNRSKSGKLYWFQSTIVPFFDTEGQIEGYISLRTDITSRAKMEREQTLINEAIKKQLTKAKDNAEQTSRLKSDFLSTMSHEIRTPMNGIIGMTDLLFDTKLDEEQIEFANIIKTSSQTLLTIINDILDFSKIEAGELKIELTEFSLQQVLEGSADVVATKAYEKSLSLMTFIDPVIPKKVIGDPTRLRQVLLNFLSNAVKFTAKGSVHLNAKLVNKTDDTIKVRIEISDSGIGISPENQENLFQPFSQADSSTTRKYGGTGLGLSISKRLVELMNGEIGLESNLGEGSTFWIELPLQIEHQKHNALIEHLSEKRVLVVGKNTGHHDIYLAYLSAWGFLINTTDNTDEMLYILEEAVSLEQNYDVVLLAELSVNEILTMIQQIHTKENLKNLPIIACQEAIDNHLKRQLIESGISSVLVKPVKQLALFDAIVAILHPEASKQIEEAPFIRQAVANGNQNLLQREHLILLVEDNLVNQQVAKHILQKLGYSIHIVNNGKEAVDSLETLPYSLVLMDCQMPIMDGFEATHAIRQREQNSESRKRIPIIAMTANAVEGDRESCLESGMDDYVSKPISVSILADVLKKWLPEIKEESLKIPMVTKEILADEFIESCPIEINRLNNLFDNDAEIITEVLDIFCDSLTPLKLKLTSAVEAKTANVKSVAHEIKGASYNVGAVILAKLSEKLEVVAAQQNWVEIENLTAKIETELDRVEEFIKSRK